MCKVSVIVPVYNAENFLQNTLNNIQRQSLKDIEIICVDDGSEDSSADIIKKFQRQDIRIRYEYQKIKELVSRVIKALALLRENMLPLWMRMMAIRIYILWKNYIWQQEKIRH